MQIIHCIMYIIHALILSPACDPNTHGIAICIHYFQVSSVKQAKLAKVVPTRNNGLPEIVTLHHDKVGDIAMFTWRVCTDRPHPNSVLFSVCLKELETGAQLTWFVFQKLRYVYHRTEERFAPVQYPVDCTFQEYLSHRGLDTDSEVAQQRQKFGPNQFVHMLCGSAARDFLYIY